MAVNKQRFFFILVLCILAVFLASCVLVIRPRFICQQGIREFKTGNYDQAAFFFERAEAAMPAIPGTTWLTAADRLCLYTHYGRTLYHTGIRDWQDNGLSPEIHDLFTRAKSYLEKAMALESGYYITAFWLARTAHALEKIHPWLFPGIPNPHDAHARYVQASALRPAGITVRQALARYLYEKDQADQIPALVRNLMEIYPPIYTTLRKEPYFTLDLVPFMAQGLENAVR
ncbi:MAG: hypothetical protein K9K40_14305, partial [Desulfotignum sp.]|nr:hypothetical protein [Desulfotignum sp.]